MKLTVEIPIEELTREQLEREVWRLRGLTDTELRRKAEHWETQYHRAGGQLEQICDTLLYHEVGHTDNPSLGVRKMGMRMKAAEEKLEAARSSFTEKLEASRPPIDALLLSRSE